MWSRPINSNMRLLWTSLNTVRILGTSDPKVAQAIGNCFPPTQVWDRQKDKRMYMIVLNKFPQNKEMAKQLIAAGNSRLFEATRCPYWAAGYMLGSNELQKGFLPGQNWLGDILMCVKNDLGSYHHSSASPNIAHSSVSTGPRVPPMIPPPHMMRQVMSCPPPTFRHM